MTDHADDWDEDLGTARPKDALLIVGGAASTATAFGATGWLLDPVPPVAMLAVGLPAFVVAAVLLWRWSE